ncbi:MAG TPA: CorA family divalent cation transporter [Candidatus Thermoplasmatota archaeon]|nr:CorA family divalent cation transporter [Candidatus Thermoplasmatota archaeon]
MSATAIAPTYEGFMVSVANGKPTRLDAPRVHDMVRGLHEAEVAWLNFEVDDLEADAQRIASILGFSGTLIESLIRTELSEYEDRDTELGMLLPIIRIENLAVEVQPLLMLVRDNFVLTMYQRGKVTRFRKFARYAETAMRKIPQDYNTPDKLTVLVTRLLDENNTRNFDGIRRIEELGEKIAGDLIQEDLDRRSLAPRIYEMKRALIQYLDGLWASLDVIQSLRHGDAELISDDAQLLARVALLGDDVQRHIQLSEHMSEVLSSGLEVMQSIYNNQLAVLNNRMNFVITWLTVLGTAVLVPNTIATVFAAWPGGTPVTDPRVYLMIMLAATLASTLWAWMWVRRKAPIPRLD